MAANGLRALLQRTRSRRAHPAGWHRTRGTVLSATVQMANHGASRAAHPLVLYTYEVEGQVFRGHRVRRDGRPADATSVIDRYPAGTSVVVHYDPTDPGNCALEL